MEKTQHAGLYRLADGRFKIDTTATNPRTGRRERVRRTLPAETTLDEALATIEGIKTEIRGAQDEPSQRLTLGAYTEAWISRRAVRLKPSTVRTYRDTLSQHILPQLGDLYADVVRRSDVEDWAVWAEQQTQSGGTPYAQDTLNKWWRVLVTLLKDMSADIGIDDPTQRLTPPRSRRVGVRETRTLAPDELGGLLDATRIHYPDRYAEIVTLAYTGMRAGELYALTWEDVDLERQSLQVRRSVSMGELTETTKTHAGREVYLPQLVADQLQEHRREMIRTQHRGLASGLVFPSNTGGVRGASSLLKPLAGAAERAGIEQHVSPQVLRRTFNTLMVSQGVDRVVLRAQMGHSSEEMTRRYAGVRLESKRDAVEQALVGRVSHLGVTPS